MMRITINFSKVVIALLTDGCIIIYHLLITKILIIIIINHCTNILTKREKKNKHFKWNKTKSYHESDWVFMNATAFSTVIEGWESSKSLIAKTKKETTLWANNNSFN